jgi:hypothetical protein
MNTKGENFVVGIVEGDTLQRFYATDRADGSPWFPERLSNADVLTTRIDAVAIAERLELKSNEKQQPHSGGTLYPNTDVQCALEISDKKRQATGRAVVFKITLDPVESFPIHGEIKVPTGYTYD